MSNIWQESKLGKTGKVVTGKTPSKDNPEDWGDDFLFITPSDYKNYGKKAYTSIRKLSKTGADRQKQRLLPLNSVLVTCIGSDMGKTVCNALPCVTNQQINAIIPHQSVIDPDYLYYVMKDLYEVLKSLGGDGTAVPILNKSDFENIDVSLPSIAEQKAIASVLSSLDDKIDLLHRQNKTLEAMAETLFRQWFVEESEESSNTIFLGDIAYFSNGKSRPEEVPNGSVPIYGGNGILGYTNQSNSNGPSIIIGRVGAYCGSLFIENKPVWISDNAMLAKPINDSSHSYLFYLLKSLRLNEFAEGSSHPLLTQALLNSIQIISPSAEKISLFCHEADKWKEKSDFNQLQIKTLETLRDTLLPKLMSGEVRVDYP